MAKKIHWSGQGGGSLRCAASRSQGLHTVMHRPCEAQKFVQLSKDSPDLYCLPCTTQARLALAKESAPKPSDVVWPTPRPISAARDTEILGYCPDIGWRRLSQMGRKWALTGAEHIADYEPTHFLPLPPEVR